MLTTAGQDFQEVIQLKELHRLECAKCVSMKVAGDPDTNGGAVGGLSTNGGAVVDIDDHMNGGAFSGLSMNMGAMVDIPDCMNGGAGTYYAYGDLDSPGVLDLSLSHNTLADSLSFLASSLFLDDIETISLDVLEPDVIWNHSLNAIAPFCSHTWTYDLSKEPQSYAEAIACPDADAWYAAMECEKEGLKQMGAFKEVELPSGERAIGLKWVYAYKTNAGGANIKEKA